MNIKEFFTNLISVLTAIICTIFPVNITVTEPAVPEFPCYEITDETIEVFELVNEKREENGIEPLVFDEKLAALAYVRAKEQVERNGHTRPDGSKYSTVLSEYDYYFRNNGENIVITGGYSAEVSVQAWLDSESHRNNMLNDFWTHSGIGIHFENNDCYIVQLFVHKK